MKIVDNKVKVSQKEEKRFDIFKRILGIIAMIIGILGLVFPIIPGWLLIFVGLELLGIQIVFFERIKDYVREKMKKGKK